MKNASSSNASKTDWARLKVMKDEEIQLADEHPEADVKHIVGGIVRLVQIQQILYRGSPLRSDPRLPSFTAPR